MRPRSRFVPDGRNGPAALDTLFEKVVEHALDMTDRIAHFYLCAIGAEPFHFTIAAIPNRFRLWVQPDDAARALMDFFQHQMPGITIIRARITQHHHRGAVVDLIKRGFRQILQRHAVIGLATAILPQRLFHHLIGLAFPH